MYNYCEDRTDTRSCEPLGSIHPEPSPESAHLGGIFVCAGRLDIKKLLKSLLIYSIPWFNLGGFVCRGEAHQSIPVATGLNPPELPISDEAWNDLRIASTSVKLH